MTFFAPSVQTTTKLYSTALVALTKKQVKSVENGVHTAHLITLPGANHYLFLSNNSEVQKDINAFLANLH